MIQRCAHIAGILALGFAASPAFAEYSSVAVNSKTGNYGYSHSWKTSSKADARAMHYCRQYSKGAEGCKVVFRTNKCAAIVYAGGALYTIKESRTRGGAEAAAMQACQAAYGNKCTLKQNYCAAQ